MGPSGLCSSVGLSTMFLRMASAILKGQYSRFPGTEKALTAGLQGIVDQGQSQPPHISLSQDLVPVQEAWPCVSGQPLPITGRQPALPPCPILSSQGQIKIHSLQPPAPQPSQVQPGFTEKPRLEDKEPCIQRGCVQGKVMFVFLFFLPLKFL
jgi:hypothetical protein